MMNPEFVFVGENCHARRSAAVDALAGPDVDQLDTMVLDATRSSLARCRGRLLLAESEQRMST